MNVNSSHKKRNIDYSWIIVIGIILVTALVVPIAINNYELNNPNNDWKGYWGGYIGAVVVALTTLIGIMITIKYNIRQINTTIEANRQQMLEQIEANKKISDMQIEANRASVKEQMEANRKLMLEDKKIDYSPFIFVKDFMPAKSDSNIVVIGSTYTEMNYSLTEKKTSTYDCGFHIKNISNNYALNLIIAAIKADNQSLFSTEPHEIDILAPNKEESFVVHVHYDEEELLKEYVENTLINKCFIVRICYNTVHDELLENYITTKAIDELGLRANKIDIHITLLIGKIDNKLKIINLISTLGINE